MSRYETLVFDVLGTLLDDSNTLAVAAEEALGDSRVDSVEGLVARWIELSDAALLDVVSGDAEFEPLDSVQARTLEHALTEAGAWLEPEALRELSRAAHGSKPFPDTVAAFNRLARNHVMIGLTNGGLSQALDMSSGSGLRWHTLVSAQTVRAYKPDPRMYAYVVDSLEVDPAAALFVAAHPWDLDGAAGQGFRTAYIDRPGSSPADLAALAGTYDIVAADLAALADQLSG